MFDFSESTGPSLGDAFAEHRTHELLASISAADTVAEPALVDDNGGNVTDRIRRHHGTAARGMRFCTVGVGMALLGGGIGVIGVFVSQFGPVDVGFSIALVGGGLIAGGAVAVAIGDVMLLGGSIRTAKALEVDRGLAWTGVGASIVGVAAFPLAPILLPVGFLCGAIQHQRNGLVISERGRALQSWTVTPTTNGFRVAGNF